MRMPNPQDKYGDMANLFTLTIANAETDGAKPLIEYVTERGTWTCSEDDGTISGGMFGGPMIIPRKKIHTCHTKLILVLNAEVCEQVKKTQQTYREQEKKYREEQKTQQTYHEQFERAIARRPVPAGGGGLFGGAAGASTGGGLFGGAGSAAPAGSTGAGLFGPP